MKNKISLPEFKVEKVFGALSEVKDWGLVQNNIPEAWKTSKGEGVTVYILDTAAYTNHPDLKENFIGGKNCSNSLSPDDLQGHGHHVFGIIAASENGVGVIGVAPKTKVFLVKVLNDSGIGSEFSIADGLKFCYEQKTSDLCQCKPDIICMSLGSDSPMSLVHDWIKRLTSLNVIVCCAAGNTGQEGVCYPAKYEETIAVAAYDKNGEIAGFSTFGDEVDFAGPGVEIYSTYLNGQYALSSGSSQANPFIVGIISLLLSKHRKQESITGKNDCKTVEQVREHLQKYAVDKGALGKDKKWGFGAINAAGLIESQEAQTMSVKEKKNLWARLKEFWGKLCRPRPS